MNSVFVLRADFGRYTSTFEKERYIGIGWFSENPIDWELSNKDVLTSPKKITQF